VIKGAASPLALSLVFSLSQGGGNLPERVRICELVWVKCLRLRVWSAVRCCRAAARLDAPAESIAQSLKGVEEKPDRTEEGGGAEREGGREKVRE
jgi:hypothetical protein